MGIYVPGSKLLILGMVIQPLIGNPYNEYINPYYWVDDHPLLYGNNGSLDPSTYVPGTCLSSILVLKKNLQKKAQTPIKTRVNWVPGSWGKWWYPWDGTLNNQPHIHLI